jgi:hypothetical protein
MKQLMQFRHTNGDIKEAALIVQPAIAQPVGSGPQQAFEQFTVSRASGIYFGKHLLGTLGRPAKYCTIQSLNIGGGNGTGGVS